MSAPSSRTRELTPNTADKLRSARPCTTPHDAHPTAERTGHHATPPHSPRFVSFIRLFGSAGAPRRRTLPRAMLRCLAVRDAKVLTRTTHHLTVPHAARHHTSLA